VSEIACYNHCYNLQKISVLKYFFTLLYLIFSLFAIGFSNIFSFFIIFAKKSPAKAKKSACVVDKTAKMV
ncbi:MAG: hypothetical protein J6D16_06290, partial [Clostridia bacterium]|nr:hypothetical protein [Clostridia bacterium]